MRKHTIPSVAALAALLALPAAQAEPITKGEVMANSCLTCHGGKGQGPGQMPAIKDFTEEGLVNKLTSFRDEDTDATVMDRHAAGYTDEEIRAVAKHIADLD